MSSESLASADGSYSEWKGWTQDSFGVLARGDADYFAKELSEITRGGPIHDVLEVGYGNGVFLRYCASQGWDVTGTELLPELIEAARRAGFTAHRADELWRVKDDSQDLIVAFDVFEHVAPADSIDFLRGLARKIRAGGSILLRYPNVDTWLGNPLQYGDVTHVNAIGALKMEYYAGEAGLAIQRLRAIRRRGFRTSMVHGVHAATAGVAIKAIAGVAKALYFPDLRVVLSSSATICILRKNDPGSTT